MFAFSLAILLLPVQAHCTARPPPPEPLLPPQPLGHRYIGCFQDGGTGNRDLTGLEGVTIVGAFTTDPSNPGLVLKMFDPEKLTLEMCREICSYGRFRYFGAQSRSFCSCGSTYGFLGSASGCGYGCSGNWSQECGGGSKNSVYEALYPPIGPKMTRVPVANMPRISASASSITHHSQMVGTVIECAAACHRSPDCLVCTFVRSSRMCRLMRFAAVPSEIVGEAQWVWMKM